MQEIMPFKFSADSCCSLSVITRRHVYCMHCTQIQIPSMFNNIHVDVIVKLHNVIQDLAYYLFEFTDDFLKDQSFYNTPRPSLTISFCLQSVCCEAPTTESMSDKEEMATDGNLNVTLTLRLLMHGKVMGRCVCLFVLEKLVIA